MNNKKDAFTLIELLIVIAIIGLLSTLAITAINSARVKARDAKRISDLRVVSEVLEMYNIENGKYPQTSSSRDYSIDDCGSDGVVYYSTEENNGYLLCSNYPLQNNGNVYLASIPQDPINKIEFEDEPDISQFGWIYGYANSLQLINPSSPPCVFTYLEKDYSGSDGILFFCKGGKCMEDDLNKEKFFHDCQ